MNKHSVNIKVAALGLVSSFILTACISANDKNELKDENLESVKLTQVYEKSFYPPSPTLKKYAEENPSCPLWSDWQSLCSYTGENGSILCHDDPSMRVEPSEPFCASEVDLTNTSKDELDSLARFCALSRETVVADEFPARKVEACFGYENKRPFSGRNMVSIDHEWCDVWRTDKGWVTCDGYEDKTLRSGQKISDISRLTCGEAILEKVEFEFATCVQWKVADVCRNPAIAFNKLDYSIKTPLSQISTIGLVHLPLPSPAYGVYCSDE